MMLREDLLLQIRDKGRMYQLGLQKQHLGPYTTADFHTIFYQHIRVWDVQYLAASDSSTEKICFRFFLLRKLSLWISKMHSYFLDLAFLFCFATE